MQRAIHHFYGVFQAVKTFVKLCQFDQGFRRGVLVLKCSLKVALGHLIVVELTAFLSRNRERICFPCSETNGLLEATFGCGCVESLPVSTAQIEQETRIGRVQAGGSFESLNSFLEITTF